MTIRRRSSLEPFRSIGSVADPLNREGDTFVNLDGWRFTRDYCGLFRRVKGGENLIQMWHTVK